MLRFLSIRRLAVIDAVDVEFGPGLNVLTGETGAGKSILVEAVGLLLGGRASADLVRTGEDVATVEAVFERPSGELIVRREVTSLGRSRAFVNGSLVTAGALKELTVDAIELHGQHEHQTLMDPSSHLSVLDAFARVEPLASVTRERFELLQRTTDALTAARRAAADLDARRDLAAFQLGELERASVKAGEDEELAATRQVLANAERVSRLCAESFSIIYESDESVLSRLAVAWRKLGELATFDSQFTPYLEARDAIKAQLEDLSTFLRRYAEGLEASPRRLHEVEERFALVERLKRKYGPTLLDVIAKHDALRRDENLLEDAGHRMAQLEREQGQMRDVFLQAAHRLSDARRLAAVRFANEFTRQLSELAMGEARFEVRFTAEAIPEEAWSGAGVDELEFFVSTNPGEELRPLARVASGGELSRMMLAVKTLAAGGRLRPSGVTAGGEARPTDDSTRVGEEPDEPRLGLIFDEIDAGIGGRVADTVGVKLRALGSTCQVLCITHLPQIAAHADRHFVVTKLVDEGRTRTTIHPLDASGRVEEIGRMLGGRAVTDAIRASAREFLALRTDRRAVPPSL